MRDVVPELRDAKLGKERIADHGLVRRVSVESEHVLFRRSQIWKDERSRRKVLELEAALLENMD